MTAYSASPRPMATPGVGVKEQILRSSRGWWGARSARDRHALHAIGRADAGPQRHAYRRLGARTDARRQRHRDGAVGSCRAKFSGCRLDAAGRASFATGCASTITPRRATCSTRRPAASGRQKVKADPSGFTRAQVRLPAHQSGDRSGRDRSNRVLTTKRTDRQFRKGFENCREAIGWDHDIMVHCHWEYDLRTAIQWPRPSSRSSRCGSRIRCRWSIRSRGSGCARSVARADLHRREPDAAAGLQGFHRQPGLRHPASGPAQQRRLSRDQADRRHGDVYGLPMATHNTGSQVHTWATCQWAASIRDLHRRARRLPARADGWTSCWCSTVRTSRTASCR